MSLFNPAGKNLMMKLDKYSCCYLDTGICPLDQMSFDEIKCYKEPQSHRIENDKSYCLGLAKKFLEGQQFHSIWVDSYSCGHYIFSDGQHRSCVVARLNNKGADILLDAEIQNHSNECYYCELSKELEKELESYSLISRVLLRRSKYKDLKAKYENLSEAYKNFSL